LLQDAISRRAAAATAERNSRSEACFILWIPRFLTGWDRSIRDRLLPGERGHRPETGVIEDGDPSV